MKNIVLFVFFLIGVNAYGQNPASDSQRWKSKTTAERDAYSDYTPGLRFLYNSDTGQFEYKVGAGAWQTFTGGGGGDPSTWSTFPATQNVNMANNNLENISESRFQDTDSDTFVWGLEELNTAGYEGDFGLSHAGIVRGSLPKDGTIDQNLHLVTKAYGDANYLGGGGSGDVVGPASSTDSSVALFDGTTGKLIKQADNVFFDGTTFRVNARNSSTNPFEVFQSDGVTNLLQLRHGGNGGEFSVYHNNGTRTIAFRGGASSFVNTPGLGFGVGTDVITAGSMMTVLGNVDVTGEIEATNGSRSVKLLSNEVEFTNNASPSYINQSGGQNLILQTDNASASAASRIGIGAGSTFVDINFNSNTLINAGIDGGSNTLSNIALSSMANGTEGLTGYDQSGNPFNYLMTGVLANILALSNATKVAPLNDTDEIALREAATPTNIKFSSISQIAATIDADDLPYDNGTSGLTATDIQAAIDEVVAEKVQVDSESDETTINLGIADDLASLNAMTPAANDLIVCKACLVITTEWDTQNGTVEVNGKHMADDRTPDEPTWTLNDFGAGEEVIIYTNRTSAPTLAGAGATFNELTDYSEGFVSGVDQVWTFFGTAISGTIDYVVTNR